MNEIETLDAILKGRISVLEELKEVLEKYDPDGKQMLEMKIKIEIYKELLEFTK